MQLTHWQLNHENQSMVLNTDPPCMGSCCTRWSSVLSFHEEYAKLMYESTNDANVRGAATKQGRTNIYLYFCEADGDVLVQCRM